MEFQRLMVRLRRLVTSGNGDPRCRAELVSEQACSDAEAFRRAMEIDPPADPDLRAAARYVLGCFHLARWEALRFAASGAPASEADLNHELASSIAAFGPYAMTTAGFVPPVLRGVLGPARRSHPLVLLGSSLLRLESGPTGDPVVLDVGIDLITAAVGLMSEDDPLLALGRSTLSEAYETRFKRSAKFADLQRAIDISEVIITCTRPVDPDYAMYLSKHRRLYETRYEVTHLIEDLRQSIDAGERSIQASATNDPYRGRRINIVGNLHRLAFIRTGLLEHVDRAIELGGHAVAAARPDHRELEVRLSNLSLAHLERHRATGMPGDLDLATTLGEEAIRVNPEEHYDLAGTLANTALCYLARFDEEGDMASIGRAIQLGERAVTMAPTGDDVISMYRSNLAIMLRKRFRSGHDSQDLDRAIEVGELAVAAARGHPIRFGYAASALAGAFRVRHQYSADPADLDRAIQLNTLYVSATPDNHPQKAQSHANLGGLYLSRFGTTRDPDDARHAVELGERALAAIPDGNTILPTVITSLSTAYVLQLQDNIAIAANPVPELARRLATARTASPIDRIMAGQALGMLASDAGDWRIAADVLDTAVSLLPIVASPRVERTDREQLLGRNLVLVSGAVAAHLALGDGTGAVQIAELGRGVLFAAELDSRSELTELARTDPQLATRFEQVRRQLDAPPLDDDGSLAGVNEGTRRQLWRDRDELLGRIRALPGLARFLRPPEYTDVQRSVRGGFGVLINATSHRGDAIIVAPDGPPIIVPLPELNLAAATKRAAEFGQIMHAPPTLEAVLNREQVLTETLGWLWDSVVAPVLEALPARDESQPTRVWWMPTGIVATLPLHAAGHPARPGALDQLISSYAPTLRALAHARTRPATLDRRQLVVAMDQTPGQPDLPGTATEAAVLHTARPDLPLLRNAEATTDNVLAHLELSTWSHFACHAVDDILSPSDSALLLHDNPFTVGRISRLRLESAELAYLSACSTAHSGWRLPDESIHLASAFHLAGFKHVIASLWPLNDLIAARMARQFYQELPSAADAEKAAIALRAVMRRLRATHPRRPDLWAALVHSGP